MICGSNSIRADSVAILTVAEWTPAVFESAFSITATQLAQCIPCTGYVLFSILFPLQLIHREHFAHGLPRLARGHLPVHAPLQMALEQKVLHSRERLPRRRGLRDDVYAVRALCDHLLEPAHLALNNLQSLHYLPLWARRARRHRHRALDATAALLLRPPRRDDSECATYPTRRGGESF